MAYRGQLTFGDISQAIGKGFRPEVKVFLQEIAPNGRTGSRVREVKGWSQVNVTRTIGGRGSASITFVNLHDRVYQGPGPKGTATRVFNPRNEDFTKQSLTNSLRQALPWIKEINPSRRKLGADTAFQGPNAFSTRERIREYIDFVYGFTASEGVALLKSEFPLLGVPNRDLVTLGLMQRVFIDIRGMDGLMYAGFSGLVSSVNDNFVPGKAPTVMLQCSDLWRLFELSELVLRAGPGVENPGSITKDVRDSIAFDAAATLGIKNLTYWETPFAGLPGQQIVHQVLRLTQQQLCFIPNLEFELDVGRETPTQVQGPTLPEVGPEVEFIDISQSEIDIQQRSEFFFDDGFWRLPKEDHLRAEYEGSTPLRRVRPGVVLTKALDVDGNEQRDSSGRKTDKLQFARPKSLSGRGLRQEGEGIKDGDFVGMLAGDYHLDKFIEAGTQAAIYQQVIKAIIGPWQTQHTQLASVLKKIQDATFYDMFLNGNGDFVYQIPRYNNHPGEYRVEFKTSKKPLVISLNAPGSRSADGSASQAAPSPNETLEQRKAREQREQSATNPTEVTEIVSDYGPDLTTTSENPFDYAPGPARYPTKFHGFNYVITDLGLRRWSFVQSEEPIVTVMRVPAGTHLVSLNEVAGNAFTLGRSSLEKNRSLQRRFGVRRRTSAQIFIPRLYQRIGNARVILDAFAQGLLQQLNGLQDSGQIEMNHGRPDLDVGANILVPERQKLYYITGISHTYTEGREASTNVTLSYGHDWAVEIPNPWTEIDLTKLLAIQRVPNRPPAEENPTVGATENMLKIKPGTSKTWKGWVWPVPTLTSRQFPRFAEPRITNSFNERGFGFHYGGDIFYRRRRGEPGVPNNGSGRKRGTGVFDDPLDEDPGLELTVGLLRVKGHFCPDGVPILAAFHGKVITKKFSTTLGWNCQIDHGLIKGFGRVRTFSQHMTVINVEPGARVIPGQQIGIVGRSPGVRKQPGKVNKTSLVHLHFEIWRLTPGKNTFNRQRDAVDPKPIMRPWGRVSTDAVFEGFTIAPGFS